MAFHKKIIVVLAVYSAFSFGLVHAATLYLTADRPQAGVGDTVNVVVRVNSGQSVDAAQGTLYYPKNLFDVEQVSVGNSVFDIWLTEPQVNASTGEISFLGRSANSFSGGSLPVFTVAFKARGEGSGSAGFRNAAVTAADGVGTNILSSSTSLAFTVVSSSTAPSPSASPQASPGQVGAAPVSGAPSAPALSVGLYPNQNAWYNTAGPFLAQWPLPTGVTDVATAINQDPQFEPAVSEGLFDNKTFDALKEGVWYLHVRFKNALGWGATAHYRMSIDLTPPLPFDIAVQGGPVTDVPAPTLQFSTQDQPSGVAIYKILTDGNAVGLTTSTSFAVPSLSFGSHAIVVQAVDYANNTTESRITLTVALPPFLNIFGVKITAVVFFGTIIAVIVIGILIGLWLGRKARAQRKNRVIIAGRDVTAAFGVIQKKVEKLASYFNGGPLNETQIEEMKFLVVSTQEALEPMKRYVAENVSEIEQ